MQPESNLPRGSAADPTEQPEPASTEQSKAKLPEQPEDPDTDAVPVLVSSGGFGETRWSEVQKAQQGSELAREAIARAYWQPLYLFAVRRGNTAPQAEDLVQEFFLRRFWSIILEKNVRERGKLRTFLCLTFRCFCCDQYKSANAKQRGGGVIHASTDDEEFSEFAESPERLSEMRAGFDRDWAINVWERAIEALFQRWHKKGSDDEFRIFNEHGIVHRDFRQLRETPDYAHLQQELGVSAGTARVRVTRFLQAFYAMMRNEVWQTLIPTGKKEHDEAVWEEEFRYLLEVLCALRQPIGGG